MRRKRLYYCAFVSKTNTLNWQYKIVMGKKCPTPARLSKQKYEKKKQKSEETKWTEANCVRSRVGTFSRTPPETVNNWQMWFKTKKKKKMWKRVHVKSKKKSQCDTNWLHPSFSRKKKVEQNKNKTSKKNSHPDQFLLWQFAMAASCFGSAYCLHIGKNPVCVRSKKKRSTRMKKEKAHVVEIYLFLLNVFWAGVDIMIRCKQNGALNIRRETACTRGTQPDSAGRRKISRYIIVLMLLVDEWRGETEN